MLSATLRMSSTSGRTTNTTLSADPDAGDAASRPGRRGSIRETCRSRRKANPATRSMGPIRDSSHTRICKERARYLEQPPPNCIDSCWSDLFSRILIYGLHQLLPGQVAHTDEVDHGQDEGWEQGAQGLQGEGDPEEVGLADAPGLLLLLLRQQSVYFCQLMSTELPNGRKKEREGKAEVIRKGGRYFNISTMINATRVSYLKQYFKI